MTEAKNKLAKFFTIIFGETIKDIIKHTVITLVIGTGGLYILWRNFQKIIGFLNSELKILWGLVFILMLLGLLFGYMLRKPKKEGFKPYFHDYGDVLWLVKPSSSHTVWIEDEPYCKKCRVQYLILGGGKLSCPQCNGMVDPLPLKGMHQAVENIAKTKAKGLTKIKLKS